MRGTAFIRFFLFSLLLLVESQSNRTISDVYVNLPATCAECRKVKYELTAHNGCYSWLTLNPQIISLEQFMDTPDCFNHAIISPVVSRPIKTVVIIKATDSVTKDALISQVKVSRLAEIRILTNFKTLDVEDVQKLYIQAFDDSNNVISSVEGLRFEWKIETNQHCLKVISSKDANYENTPARLDMEAKRFQTDLIIVKGVHTGVVKVSARILEKDYEIVKKAEISLFVIEPFFLIPDKPVYLLTNSDFPYKIGKGKRDIKGRQAAKYIEVKLPDSQYHFIPGDAKMLGVVDTGIVHTKDIIGEVLVRVEDTTLVNNTVEGLIIIVEPEVVDLHIRDVSVQVKAGVPLEALLQTNDFCEHLSEDQGYDNWNLVVGHTYVVTSCLLDSSKNIITLTPNVAFDIMHPDANLKKLVTNSQQSSVLFEAIEQSPKGVKLRSTLNIKNDPRYKPSAEKDVRIYSRVKITYPLPTVILPYLARTLNKKQGQQDPQQYTLEAIGGSGLYKWNTADGEIVPVTQQGTVFGLKMGITKITASDALNPLNNDTIEVEVTRVARLAWLEEKMELPVDSKEIMNAIALDGKGRKFTNCTEIPLIWSVKDENAVRIKDGNNEQVHTSYDALKRYVYGPGKDLIKLRYAYDTMEIVPNDISNIEFNEWLHLHNSFGICGQRSISTIHEGMARVSATFSIIEEDGLNYKRESDYANILVYKPLKTMSPNYEEFLMNLKSDEKDESYRKYMLQLKSEQEFVLGYGSGLFWQVNGGTTNWIDLPGHYIETVKVDKLRGDTGANLNVHSLNDFMHGMRPQHYFECPVPEPANLDSNKDDEFKLTLVAGNKRAKSLLRPATNSAIITIMCQLPQSMQLAWAQKEHMRYEKFPKKETEGDIEPDTYYVRNGQVLNIRMLVFDKYRRIFYNFSSYGREEITTNDKLGYVEPLQPYYMHQLLTTKETGSFLVRGNLVGLTEKTGYSKLLDLTKVWDTMRINTVNLLKVDPEYKLLYLHERNKLQLKILHGSGSFAIKPNVTGIIDIQYNPKIDPRLVTITPINEGYVGITIEDIGVDNSITASSVILVSDVDRILLKQDLLMELGTSQKIQASYYAINGEQFPFEQYQFINAHIYQERKRSPTGRRASEYVDKGLVITQEADGDIDIYQVFAKEIGGYEVTAATNRRAKSDTRTETFSNPIYIEVFPYLQIYPRKLLLVPDGSYTLKIFGGPSSISMDSEKSIGRLGGSLTRIFKSADPNIATVDPNTGEVTGRHVGDTLVYVTIAQELRDPYNGGHLEELCKRAVPVRVKLATHVEIAGIYKRPILTGATVRLLAVLKHYNETFTYGVFPIEYWWTSKQFHVLGLAPYGISRSKENSYSAAVQGDQLAINAKGLRQGEAEISVFVTITYPLEYRNEPHEFNVSSIARVVNGLYGSVPTFLETQPAHTSTYLLPPRASHRLPANKENNMKLSYQQLSCANNARQYNILTLSEENLVKTYDHYGSATVMVEESSMLDQMRSAYYIEVTPIHSIAIEKSIDIISVPLGADVTLKVVYQDKFGRSFADPTEGIDAMIDLSHPRVVRADLDYYNSTLTVRALSLGSSNIHIFFPGREDIFDLVRVHVTSVIEPVSPVFVHVGGTVQFRTSFNYSSLGRPVWGSEDPTILEVNPVTGLGKARNEGATNVHINDTIHLTTSVTCGRVKYISMDLSTAPKMITNIDSHKSFKSYYKIQFRIHPDDPNIDITPGVSDSPLVNHNVQFDCKSLSPDWIIAKTEDDVSKGQMKGAACYIYTKPSAPSDNIPATVSIEVSAGSLEMNYMKTEHFTFPFVSAFKVQSVKDLVFSKTNRTKSFRVPGSTDLKVWVEDPTQCDVRVSRSDVDNMSEIYVTIPREVQRSFKGMKLFIENTQTGQKETVTITYFHEVFDVNEVPEVQSTSTISLTDIFTILVIIITVVIVIRYLLCQNGNEYRQPVPPMGQGPRMPAPAYAGMAGQRRFGGSGATFGIFLEK